MIGGLDMKKKEFDAFRMVREIRDKQAEEFWRNPDLYLKKLKTAAEKLRLNLKKRKCEHVT